MPEPPRALERSGLPHHEEFLEHPPPRPAPLELWKSRRLQVWFKGVDRNSQRRIAIGTPQLPPIEDDSIEPLWSVPRAERRAVWEHMAAMDPLDGSDAPTRVAGKARMRLWIDVPRPDDVADVEQGRG